MVRIRPMKRSEAHRDESQTSRVQGNYACTKCSYQAEPNLTGMSSISAFGKLASNCDVLDVFDVFGDVFDVFKWDRRRCFRCFRRCF